MDEQQRTRDPMMADSNWRIEKKIPVAMLGAILMQTFAIVVWGTQLSSRVSYLEANRVDTAQFAVMAEKITSVQSNIIETKQDIGGVKSDINSLKEEIRRSSFNGKR